MQVSSEKLFDLPQKKVTKKRIEVNELILFITYILK